jgi:hypothetical protein
MHVLKEYEREEVKKLENMLWPQFCPQFFNKN